LAELASRVTRSRPTKCGGIGFKSLLLVTPAKLVGLLAIAGAGVQTPAPTPLLATAALPATAGVELEAAPAPVPVDPEKNPYPFPIVQLPCPPENQCKSMKYDKMRT
jgi:hypothetical protein